ncbi:MAG: NUDIX domain-containing protein [Candidatus Woesearchaeota archaeon]
MGNTNGFFKENETFEQGAKREVEEEFLSEVISLNYLGKVNANPARFTNYLNAYAAEVDPEKKLNVKEDKLELISKRRFFLEEEIDELIRKGKIINGLSLAALQMFNAYKKEIVEDYKKRHYDKLQDILKIREEMWSDLRTL